MTTRENLTSMISHFSPIPSMNFANFYRVWTLRNPVDSRFGCGIKESPTNVRPSGMWFRKSWDFYAWPWRPETCEKVSRAAFCSLAVTFCFIFCNPSTLRIVFGRIATGNLSKFEKRAIVQNNPSMRDRRVIRVMVGLGWEIRYTRLPSCFQPRFKNTSQASIRKMFA